MSGNVQLYKIWLFVFTVHMIGLVTYGYALWYDWYFVDPPFGLDKRGKKIFGGKFRFLTYICLIIQTVYFVLCILNDLIGTHEVAPKKTPLIRKVKDYVFASLAFPIAMNVGITFWTLMAIDRELVFPKAFDAFFPAWLNHVMHTNIMIFIILELCTSFRRYPTKTQGLVGLSIFMAFYLAWIHVIKHVSGIWVYPVLDVLELPQRIVFFVVILIFCIVLYRAGEFMNNQIWAKELKVKSAQQKNKRI